jgi:hypothetical protein
MSHRHGNRSSAKHKEQIRNRKSRIFGVKKLDPEHAKFHAILKCAGAVFM